MSAKVVHVFPNHTRVRPSLRSRLSDAVTRAAGYLLKQQDPEGWWLGELEGDTILESEWILLMVFLQRGDDTKLRKAAAYIRSKQMSNGGWAIFPGGPVDASASIKAYFALKLTGATADEPCMTKARQAIADAGGMPAANSYTRFYLALLGQIPWSCVPAVPPEIMLLPRWFYFNLYAISSWSRTFVVPLSIIWTHKPVTRIDHACGIGELFGPGDVQAMRLRMNRPMLSWRNFFLGVDRTIKLAERFRLLPLRVISARRAETWMIDHFDYSSGLGAIFPPMVYALVALRALGYPDDHPQAVRARRELELLEIEEEDILRLQPCMSPVWDTAIAVNALAEAGVAPGHPALVKAAEWLVSKEVKIRGDWQVTRPQLEQGGWYFEWHNDFYPDIDDTAMILMGLRKVDDVPGKEEACRRALEWLLGMQGSDGGWASFDADNNRSVFNAIPFADHNAMLDPSTADITARILEMLSFYGIGPGSRAAKRGIEFVRREQESDGSWYGRWGVNYIYGTWQAIRGLTRIGVGEQDPMIRRGAQWLKSVQNQDGGWGESCMSYYDPALKGQGPSTASQTAWAVMGLICAGEGHSEAVARGIDFLLRTQRDDGTWDEDEWTGAGFPKVFFLRYHLYRHYFPLMALGMYRTMCAPQEETPRIEPLARDHAGAEDDDTEPRSSI